MSIDSHMVNNYYRYWLVMYWILNKFVKFMTAGHLKLKDLIRAGLWSMIVIFHLEKITPK